MPSSGLELYIKTKEAIERLLARGTLVDGGARLTAEEIAKWKERLALANKAIELLRRCS